MSMIPMSDEERKIIVELALGRIFKIMSRPHQPGDERVYEDCRAIILDNTSPIQDHSPNWVRDRLKGAGGD